MPPDDAQAKLERALIAAADALAELPARQWQRLCREEVSELVTSMQYFEAMGVPDSFPPERLLGAAIIRHLAARHPHMLGGAPEAA